MHEARRQPSRSYMSDVYDSPRWQEKVGPPSKHRVQRVGFQYCVDGVAICSRLQVGSFKPCQLINLSLPPWLRYKSRHLIVQMLIPAHLKASGARKYYNWAALYEMNELYCTGVSGVRVVMFGSTLDAPGRRELLNMQSVTAFFPCPHCLHTAQPGRKGQCFGGFRRFLPMGSPWRQRTFVYKGSTYEFRDVERRSPPVLRTDDNVEVMLRIASTNNKPFCGHKGLPLLHNWMGVDWAGSLCDVMHDMKCMSVMIIKCLVGKGKDGMYKNWSKDKDIAHRKDCQLYGIFETFANGDTLLPPWRLSADAVEIMDMRVRRMWWPHYVDVLAKNNHSFWTHSDRMWKSSNKLYVLMVLLPTCLRGFVPAVHKALLHLVDSLRHLDGQVYSASESQDRGILPGSHAIHKRSIPRRDKKLIRGLVLLEGSFPVGHINPATHHVVHYAPQTGFAGLLRLIAMWCFERNNKYLKQMIRNKQQALATLAQSILMDIATRQLSYAEKTPEMFEGKHPVCVLSVQNRKTYCFSRQERFELGMLGITSIGEVRGFNVAYILGVHFKADEWGKSRCGSVIVTQRKGVSRYCIVKKFLQVQGKYYARVTWLSRPEYPYAPIRLVVRVRMQVLVEQTDPCFVSMNDIVPCRVSVMPDEDGVHFFVMRDSGYDRVRRV